MPATVFVTVPATVFVTVSATVFVTAVVSAAALPISTVCAPRDVNEAVDDVVISTICVPRPVNEAVDELHIPPKVSETLLPPSPP